MYGERDNKDSSRSRVTRRQVFELGGVAAVGLAMSSQGEAIGQALPKNPGHSVPVGQGHVDLRSINLPSYPSMYVLPYPEMRYVFENMTEFYPHSVMWNGTDQPQGLQDLQDRHRDRIAAMPLVNSNNDRIVLEKLLSDVSSVDEMIILKGNDILYEFGRGSKSRTHLIMSITKTFVGTVIAQMAAEGLVDVSNNVASYIASLKGTDWDGVSVQNILNMTSGINAFDDAEGSKKDPSNQYFAYEASVGWLSTKWHENTYNAVAKMKRHLSPGQAFEYSSVNTFVLAWLAEEVLESPFTHSLSERVWSRIGAEGNAYFMVSSDGAGAPAADGGLSCSLRDLARFGMHYTHSVQRSGHSVIPRGHVEHIQKSANLAAYSRTCSAAASRFGCGGADREFYAWQWGGWNDGDLFHGGWGGQGLFVSPSRDIVIAYFSASPSERAYRREGTPPLNFADFVRQIANGVGSA